MLGDPAPSIGNRGRHLGGVPSGRPRLLGPNPRLPLRGCCPAQRIRPPANGIRPFLGGANHQPRFHLDGPGRLRRGLDLLALAGRCLDNRLGLLGGT